MRSRVRAFSFLVLTLVPLAGCAAAGGAGGADECRFDIYRDQISCVSSH
jgi:hypothetical protein